MKKSSYIIQNWLDILVFTPVEFDFKFYDKFDHWLIYFFAFNRGYYDTLFEQSNVDWKCSKRS